MSLLKRLIKYPVVAPTISSLIILGILELTGYLPTAWNWLRVAFLMVRDLLMAAIPVWIVIAIGFTVWLLKKLLKKKNQSQPQTTKITDLERKILFLLVELDERPIGIDDIALRLPETRLNTTSAIKLLKSKGIVEYAEGSWATVSGYYFTAKDRALVVELGIS